MKTTHVITPIGVLLHVKGSREEVVKLFTDAWDNTGMVHAELLNETAGKWEALTFVAPSGFMIGQDHDIPDTFGSQPGEPAVPGVGTTEINLG